MREIRFRAWDGERMFTPNIIPNPSASQDHLGGVLMQFTGLLDKNGTPVYEGDLVKHCNGATYEVKWNQLHCQWGLYLNGGMSRELGADWITANGKTPTTWETASLEVVGNIYQGITPLEAP